jgi:hypothetical protein
VLCDRRRKFRIVLMAIREAAWDGLVLLPVMEKLMRLLPAMIVRIHVIVSTGVTCLDYGRGRNASVMHTGHLHGS